MSNSKTYDSHLGTFTFPLAQVETGLMVMKGPGAHSLAASWALCIDTWQEVADGPAHPSPESTSLQYDTNVVGALKHSRP